MHPSFLSQASGPGPQASLLLHESVLSTLFFCCGAPARQKTVRKLRDSCGHLHS